MFCPTDGTAKIFIPHIFLCESNPRHTRVAPSKWTLILDAEPTELPRPQHISLT